ncbi:TonB-dependent receptor [Rhodohalobacter sp. SW132]|uniref:TonB-dependent receptor n=1 Tax=Rhodohalobacter sp. SW132 TaxID=2293433 RepID=UPI000E255B33|nr:TonB-dependent receptor [Rhodohalobacter sp. SW132]REL24956.1 TonB-dependent receptor [Rhodohalobacter sp. SW132]
MKNRLLSSVSIMTLVTLLITIDVFAQNTGRITGVITDQVTEETLAGATVQIAGTTRGVVTDQNGRYNLVNVPAGSIQLQVSYIGYQRRTIEVEVEAGEVVDLDILLRWDSVEGDEVSITAQALGQTRAINEQLRSNTISNIVSSDRIRELPDVNAAESIGRLPGIAIQRSGGEANKVLIRGMSPKFSTVSVNGVRVPSTGGDDRSIDLSLISSNMLDGIEVKKANTPDMDADAIAGSVDLRLRDAPEGLLFDIQGQGGYNQLQDYYGNYKISGSVSNRFLDNRLGVIATVNVDEHDRSADQLNAGYARYDFPDSDDIGVRLTSVNAQEHNTIRGRQGGSLLLDYRLPNGKIAANTFYNELSNEGVRRTNNILADRPGSEINIFSGTTTILTSAISVEQDYGWVQFDAGASRTHSASESPRNYYTNFRLETQGAGAPGFPSDSVGMTPAGVLNYYEPNDAMRLDNTNINETRRDETNYTVQLNATFPFNIGSRIDGEVKTGGKVRWFNKSNEQNQFGRSWAYAGLAYNEQTGEPTGYEADLLRCIYNQFPNGELNGYNVYQEQVVNDSDYQYIPIVYFDSGYSRNDFLSGEGGFPIGYNISPEDAKAFTDAADNCVGRDGRGGIFENVNASRNNDYSGEERIDAAYIMSEVNLGRYVKLIPGVRWEHEYSRYVTERFREVVTNNVEQPPQDVTELDVTRNYSFILPMVHLQIAPTDWLQIRLARTETIARPDYTQYIPRTNVNSMFTEINANNTDLRPAKSNNYDASVSVYQNHVGLFTVSGFHKTVEDLPLWKRSHQRTQDPLPDGLNIPQGRDINGDGTPDEPDWTWNDPRITTYINAPFDSEYWGIEFDWQTNFWYLPSVFQGLVLNINYTRMFSDTSFLTTVTSHRECVNNCGTPFATFERIYKDTLRTGARAFDQPAHLANITVGYDYKGFSTRLSYLYQGDRLTGVASATEPVRDSYSAAYRRWDLTVKQRIQAGFLQNANLELFANFSNLTSTPDRNLIGGDGDRSLGFGSPTFVEYYGFTMDLGLRFRL